VGKTRGTLPVPRRYGRKSGIREKEIEAKKRPTIFQRSIREYDKMRTEGLKKRERNEKF